MKQSSASVSEKTQKLRSLLQIARRHHQRRKFKIMGKGRAPCCDKTKVKRGPWSPEEDLKLMTFIHKHGHDNWRALPKLAGLVRCGKSCRLRWINYLRPDVKRGNFSKEEEDTIIGLHHTFGNKWSKIASHLPGRTDNEIKNVWNTHLKKRLKPKPSLSITTTATTTSTLSSASSSSSEKMEQDLAEKQVPNEAINNGVVTEDPKESQASVSSSDHSSSKQEGEDEQILESLLKEDEDPLLQIPMDPLDYDIWNILENPESFQSNDFTVPTASEDDADKNKWFSELENELGLGTSEGFNLASNDVDMDFQESSWSFWPEIYNL